MAILIKTDGSIQVIIAENRGIVSEQQLIDLIGGTEDEFWYSDPRDSLPVYFNGKGKEKNLEKNILASQLTSWDIRGNAIILSYYEATAEDLSGVEDLKDLEALFKYLKQEYHAIKRRPIRR